jgi:hypothetical protein
MQPFESDWKPWPGESRRAYRAFECYLDEPEMTVAGVAKKAKCTPKTAEHWSLKFAWTRRRRNHERWLSEQSRTKADKAIIAARARHASQCHALSQTLLLPVFELSRRITAGTFNIAALTDRQLLELTVRAAAALPRVLTSEREALGDAEGYVPGGLKPEDDVITDAVMSDDEAMACAARLTERVGTLLNQQNAAAAANVLEQREAARKGKRNTDWNGDRPSINHSDYDPITGFLKKPESGS